MGGMSQDPLGAFKCHALSLNVPFDDACVDILTADSLGIAIDSSPSSHSCIAEYNFLFNSACL